MAPKPVSVVPSHHCRLITLPHCHAISAICAPTDPKILNLSGRVLPSCDLARRYRLRDVDGKSSGLAAAWSSASCSLLLPPSRPTQPSWRCPRSEKRGSNPSLLWLAGRPIHNYLSVSSVLSNGTNMGWLASYMPGFLRAPKWILTLCTSKF